jgi:uncharacterized protein YbjQ (UPF0145 family)
MTLYEVTHMKLYEVTLHYTWTTAKRRKKHSFACVAIGAYASEAYDRAQAAFRRVYKDAEITGHDAIVELSDGVRTIR